MLQTKGCVTKNCTKKRFVRYDYVFDVLQKIMDKGTRFVES